MPFDVLPQETKTKVARFQHLADALLRGCKFGHQIKQTCDGRGNTCARGAYMLGAGLMEPSDQVIIGCTGDEWNAMEAVYQARYNSFPMKDNDERGFTREQIAARIAAL